MKKSVWLAAFFVCLFFPGDSAYAQKSWLALTGGGGKDVDGGSERFGVVRVAVGTGVSHVGLQAGLAYLRENGGNSGQWTLDGVVSFRRLLFVGPAPYVFAGVGGLFSSREVDTPRFNFGGGLNYFLTQRWGLRVEVRDMVFPKVHHVEFTGGLVFRF